MHGCVPEREIDRQKERGFRRIYTQYNMIYTFILYTHTPKKYLTHYQKKIHYQKKNVNIKECIDITFGRMSLLRRSCSQDGRLRCRRRRGVRRRCGADRCDPCSTGELCGRASRSQSSALLNPHIHVTHLSATTIQAQYAIHVTHLSAPTIHAQYAYYAQRADTSAHLAHPAHTCDPLVKTQYIQ